MNRTIILKNKRTEQYHLGYDNIIFFMILLYILIYSLKLCCIKCQTIYIEYRKKLPEIKYKRIHSTDDVCTICIENLETNEKIIKLNCEHMFHPNCIKPWIDKHERCPNCNSDIFDNTESQLLQ